MSYPKWIRPLFIVSGLYDGILGVIFLAAPLKIFEMANLTPPNHLGYLQFPASLLIIFALMFFAVAQNPAANKNLILYGILLKVSYCSVVFSHQMTKNIPSIWAPFAYLDLAFLIVFVIAYRTLRGNK